MRKTYSILLIYSLVCILGLYSYSIIHGNLMVLALILSIGFALLIPLFLKKQGMALVNALLVPLTILSIYLTITLFIKPRISQVNGKNLLSNTNVKIVEESPVIWNGKAIGIKLTHEIIVPPVKKNKYDSMAYELEIRGEKVNYQINYYNEVLNQQINQEVTTNILSKKEPLIATSYTTSEYLPSMAISNTTKSLCKSATIKISENLKNRTFQNFELFLILRYDYYPRNTAYYEKQIAHKFKTTLNGQHLLDYYQTLPACP